MHQPSPYQQAIYNTAITTNKNIIARASAGSGKSTCLVEVGKLVGYTKKCCFVAFNNHIVKELKGRLPMNMLCSTMHSLGLKQVRSHYQGNISVNKSKQIGFIEPFFSHLTKPREKWKAIYATDHLMSLARATMTKPIRSDLARLVDRYVLDTEEEEIRATVSAMRKFEAYNNDNERGGITLDFQDMISLPALRKDIRIEQFDFVFVDEIQDLSDIDRMFLLRLIKPGTGRLFGVGDPWQSIYSFRGAAMDSFEQFTKLPNTIELPLTMSYRCPKNVVKEAKKVNNEIEAFEENEDGIVRDGKVEEIQEGDMVLCRNTRPLIEVFLQLVDQGKRAYVVGKEMEKGLLAMLAELNSTENTTIWLDYEKQQKEKITNKLSVNGITNPKKHPKYALVEEKLAILHLLFEKFETIGEVEDYIREIFEDDNEEDEYKREGVRMLTIHRAKGSENDRVFIIKEFEGKPLIPSPYAVTEEMLQQETNLEFVSITRAKKELIYLYL